MSLDDQTRKRIDTMIAADEVVLFMKGNRAMPACGFSSRVVGILDELLEAYSTTDVLRDPAIRDGIKEYSDWPTLPQLYVKGEFVGGCDIVVQMHESGDLEGLLGASSELPSPTIHVDAGAASELAAALEECDPDHDHIRIEIDSQFRHGLVTDAAGPRDVEVEVGGVAFVLDRSSARRADGLRIGFVEEGGGGFRMENPNAPPTVKQINVHELAIMLSSGKEFELIDVRNAQERQVAKLDAALPLDEDALQRLEALPKNTPLVFLCHHGMRSQSAAAQFLAQGYTDVSNVQGGIDAWSVEVDPSVPRY
jgi:monothiol glutaredoxin